MGRRRRLVDKGSQQRNGTVMVSRVSRTGWSLPQAADLLQQGYTDEHVERTTGFAISIVRNYQGGRQ